MSDRAQRRLDEDVGKEKKMRRLIQQKELDQFFLEMNRAPEGVAEPLPSATDTAEESTGAISLKNILAKSKGIISGGGREKYVSSNVSLNDSGASDSHTSTIWDSIRSHIENAAHGLRWDFAVRRGENITKERQKKYLHEFIQRQSLSDETKQEQLRLLQEDVLFQDTVPNAHGGITITPVGIMNFMRDCQDQNHVRKLRDIFHNSDNVYDSMFHYMTHAAETHPKARLLLGYLQLINQGQPEMAFETIREAASEGEKEAHHQLSIMFYYGIGTKRSVGMALHHLQTSAFMQYLPAVHQLGLLHRRYNSQKMLGFLRSAAEGGYPEAMYDLGRIYLTGDGVVRNHDEAFHWLEEAHQAGEHRAATQLGLCYANGLGVVKNESIAFDYWVDGTMRQHDPESVRYLGIAYEEGIGIEKDENRALHLYEIAANNQDVQSMFLVGHCYENGIGCERNLKNAFGFYLEAGRRQNEDGAAAALRLHQEEGFELDEHDRMRLTPLADPSLVQELKTMDQMRSLREKRGASTTSGEKIEDEWEEDQEHEQDEVEEDIEFAEILEKNQEKE